MGRFRGGVVGAIVLLGMSTAWAQPAPFPNALGAQACWAQAYSEVPRAGNAKVGPQAGVAGEAEWIELRDVARARGLRVVIFVAGSELALALLVAAACWLVLTVIGTWLGDDEGEDQAQPVTSLLPARPRPEACVLLEPRMIRHLDFVRPGSERIPSDVLAILNSLHLKQN